MPATRQPEGTVARVLVEDVIVPVDGSSFALGAAPLAAELASRLGAELTYLAVGAPGFVHPRPDELRFRIEEAGLPAGNVQVESSREAWWPIVDRAGRSSSLVVMTTHGRGRVAGAIIGSVAEQVLRRTERPVVLVGPLYDTNTAPSIANLMVCVDGSAMSESILPVAMAWGRVLGAGLEIVTVLPESARLGPGPGRAGDVVESSYVHGLAHDLAGSGVEAEWEVLHGDPASAIVDHARVRPGTMIAMTTHGRGGPRRLVLGSVAAQVAHDATVPILVHRSPSLA